MKKIAIIPARSGSKGLPNKNILMLGNKPLIAYTIEAALKSREFERVIVSTDSLEYKYIAEKFGAEVFMRSEELSNDKASSFVVIEDVLNKIETTVDYFVLLQVTSPFRNENHIKESIKLFGEYTKQEAFWYLNLNFNNGFQVSGYTPFENERKLLIFITMDNLLERADYSNEFYDSQTFSWFSKSSRYLRKDNKLTIEGKIAENFYEINVFVKKNNGENFYYLGDVEKVISAKEIKDSQGKSMVKYIFKLKKDVKKELLDYFNM